MGRKKGKQSFGFTSKAQRASFCTEWQTHVTEAVETLRRRQRSSSSSSSSSLIHSNINHNNNQAQQHRVVRLKTLRNILQERVLLDEMEHRETSRQQRLMLQQSQSQQQSLQQQPRPNSNMTSSSSAVKLPPPGSLVYYTKSDPDDDEEEVVEKTNHPPNRCHSTHPLSSLQMLCVQTLGPILPHYIQAMGVEAVHHCLSLLPGPTLTALSVVVARRASSSSSSTTSSTTTATIQMNRDLVHVLGNHPHVQRLALYRIPEASMLQDLIPRVRHNVPLAQLQVHVPDCWEEDDHDHDEFHEKEDHHDDNNKYYHSHMPSLLGCTQLQRLELAHVLVGCRRWTAMEPLRDLFTKCGATLQYISLIHSFHVHTGPGLVLLLPTLVPHLRMLDVSDNDWITESVLRQFWQGYINEHTKKENEKKQQQEKKEKTALSPTDGNNHDDETAQGEDQNGDDDDETNKTDDESDNDDDDDDSLYQGNIASYAQQPIPQHVVDLLPVVRAMACPNLVTSMKLGLDLDFPNKLIHK